MQVLLVLLSTICAAIAYLGWTMCRLAARSDRSRAMALADWLAASGLSEQRVRAAAHRARQQHQRERQRRARRATG